MGERLPRSRGIGGSKMNNVILEARLIPLPVDLAWRDAEVDAL
jgi:hypothetical protein